MGVRMCFHILSKITSQSLLARVFPLHQFKRKRQRIIAAALQASAAWRAGNTEQPEVIFFIN